jgi:hypothetical protein
MEEAIMQVAWTKANKAAEPANKPTKSRHACEQDPAGWLTWAGPPRYAAGGCCAGSTHRTAPARSGTRPSTSARHLLTGSSPGQ